MIALIILLIIALVGSGYMGFMVFQYQRTIKKLENNSLDIIKYYGDQYNNMREHILTIEKCIGKKATVKRDLNGLQRLTLIPEKAPEERYSYLDDDGHLSVGYIRDKKNKIKEIELR